MVDPMSRLEHVAMRYGHGPLILHDVNLTLRRGQFVLVSGQCGAGKTSLLRLLGLVHPPCEGRLTMSGHDVTRLERAALGALRRRIGSVFQDLRLLDHLSAFDNVALPLRIRGGDEARIRGAVLEMLGWLGLSQVVEASPPTLSMEQRQLVAVARAVIAHPDLLLCDEPTRHLGPAAARRIMRLLARFAGSGTTVVVATPAARLASGFPHLVLCISDGRLNAPIATAAAQ